MAFTINIYYSGKNGSAKAFVKEVSENLLEQIRNFEGSLRYQYFFSAEDENQVLLVDRWESRQALDNYHASPIMQQIARLREKYNLTMQVERFCDDEVPTSDKAFVRHTNS